MPCLGSMAPVVQALRSCVMIDDWTPVYRKVGELCAARAWTRINILHNINLAQSRVGLQTYAYPVWYAQQQPPYLCPREPLLLLLLLVLRSKLVDGGSEVVRERRGKTCPAFRDVSCCLPNRGLIFAPI